MRLTCPNCGAQYEVDNDLVPLDGRDVQCSNCNETWFQDHPGRAPAVDYVLSDEDDAANAVPEFSDEFTEDLEEETETAAAAVFSRHGARQADGANTTDPKNMAEDTTAEPSETSETSSAEADASGDEDQDAKPEPAEEPKVEIPKAASASLPDESAAAVKNPQDGLEDDNLSFDQSSMDGPQSDWVPDEAADKAPDHITEPAASDQTANDDGYDDDDDAPIEAPPSEIDPAVLSILREEAERETQARREEEAGAEAAATSADVASPDLLHGKRSLSGMVAGAFRRGKTDADEDDDDEDFAPPPKTEPTSARLPDIDLINATLRAAHSTRPEEDANIDFEAMMLPARNRGYRIGFSLALGIAAVLLIAYLFASGISAQYPEAEPYLTAFVTQVNDARTTVSLLAEKAINAINDLASGLDS